MPHVGTYLRTSLALAVLACGDGVDRAAYFSDHSHPDIRERGRNLRVALVRELGAASDTGRAISFGRIASLGARGDGRVVAVADGTTCQVYVFAAGWATVDTVGRCGSGPGEFSDMLHSVAFLGDTLVVMDGRRRDWSLFDSTGQFVRTIRPSLAEPGGFADDQVHFVDDSSFVAVFRRIPRPDRYVSDVPYRHVFLARRDGGATIASAVTAPPLADSALRRSVPLVTTPGICVPPGLRHPIVAVGNTWANQLVLLALPTLATVANVAAPLDWRPLSERPNRPGERRPPRGPDTIVCGTDFILVARASMAELNVPRSVLMSGAAVAPPPLIRARWDFYTYDGRLQYTLEDSLPQMGPDSLLVTTPAALIGERLFTYSNDLRGHPVVLEYRVGFDGRVCCGALPR